MNVHSDIKRTYETLFIDNLNIAGEGTIETKSIIKNSWPVTKVNYTCSDDNNTTLRYYSSAYNPCTCNGETIEYILKNGDNKGYKNNDLNFKLTENSTVYLDNYNWRTKRTINLNGYKLNIEGSMIMNTPSSSDPLLTIDGDGRVDTSRLNVSYVGRTDKDYQIIKISSDWNKSISYDANKLSQNSFGLIVKKN